MGRCPLQKLSLLYYPHLAARQVAKFHEATPFGSKVLTANTLHFKPILDLPLKKIVRKTHVPNGGELVQTSLASVKIWERSTP